MKLALRIKQYFSICVFLTIGLVLSSCKPIQPKYPTAGQQIDQTLVKSIQTDRGPTRTSKKKSPLGSQYVNSSLLPPLSVDVSNAGETQERHFNVTANDMPAKTFFLGLVAGTPYNMLVSPTATGNITLNLKNVTIEQALEATRDLYGYEYKKTDAGFEILPKKMITRIFNINYLNINRAGQSQTQLVSTDITNINNGNTGTNNSGSNTYTPSLPTPTSPNSPVAQAGSTQGSGSTVVTKESNDFWTDLTASLKTLIGDKEGRWVITNPQASVVMVHAYPNELHQISDYLNMIQRNLQREVIIEAKILEVTLNDNYQAGINWSILSATQDGTNGLSTAFANGGQMFSVAINISKSFSSVINLLAQQGNIQVLSSPHISTINNQEAVIKVGNDQFFVTGYTSNITPTGSTNTTSQSVALNPFFSGITLDVTPQISSSGAVTLYIHPSISKVTSEDTTIQLGNTSGTGESTLILPLASSTIRESDDVVHAQNGQIIVIGGLMQNSMSEVTAGTPGLNKIPVAGTLARNTNQIMAKTELVILLKPIVVHSGQGWANRMQELANSVKTAQRGYHTGGLPEDFGNTAEFTR